MLNIILYVLFLLNTTKVGVIIIIKDLAFSRVRGESRMNKAKMIEISERKSM